MYVHIIELLLWSLFNFLSQIPALEVLVHNQLISLFERKEIQICSVYFELPLSCSKYN